MIRSHQPRPKPRWLRVSPPLFLLTVAFGALCSDFLGFTLVGGILAAIPAGLLMVLSVDLLLGSLDRSRYGVGYMVAQERLPVGCWIGLACGCVPTLYFFVLSPLYSSVLLPRWSWPLDSPIVAGDLQRLENLLLDDPQLVHSLVRPRRGPGWISQGWEPIHLAAYVGNTDVTALLVRKGADINSRGHGKLAQPPLFLAVQENKGEMVRWLIDQGAAVNESDIRGFLPLHIAVREGSTEICEILLAAGADINARDDYSGKTPLDFAERHMSRFLWERGAIGSGGFCPTLGMAVRSLRVDLVRELLSHGADPNATNGRGETPLHIVIRATYRPSMEALEIVRLLLNHGADPTACDLWGRTPHSAAVENGNLDALELLLLAEDGRESPDAEVVGR